MPVELRKRKAPVPPPVSSRTQKKTKRAQPVTKKAIDKVEDEAPPKISKAKEVAEKTEDMAKTNGAAAAFPAKGDTIALDEFGGEVETNDGEKTTLKALVDESKSGVVLFTYPRASTPGCTKQVCLFRDEYEMLTKTGLLIFGLSADSTKANTTFKEKQKLTYPLICDSKRTLINAIGLKKAPNGTQRGVFVVDKTGLVLAAQAGTPQGTVDIVKAIVEEIDDANEARETADEADDADEDQKTEEETKD